MTISFMGTQGFTWFIGKVEDNNDPARLGTSFLLEQHLLRFSIRASM